MPGRPLGHDDFVEFRPLHEVGGGDDAALVDRAGRVEEIDGFVRLPDPDMVRFPAPSRPFPAAGIARLALAAALAFVSAAAPLRAEFLLHPLFSDHAVLQRDLPLPVWGWADPGSEVVVEFAGQRRTTAADDGGAWLVLLDPLPANAEPAVLTASSGGAELQAVDLLVGEVWVCSGQSNMVWPVARSSDVDEALATAESGALSALRLFRVPVAGADERADTVKAAWQTASAQTVGTFSATGFYFGQALAEALEVPVGLVQSANGGTNAYSWINTETFLHHPAGAPTRELWERSVATYPEATERYERALAAWQSKAEEARAAGSPPPGGRAPQPPLGPDSVKRPAGHYNAMIAPLQPLAMRGVVWYQGEGNSRPPFAPQYRDLMFALLEGWRADWAAALPEVPRREFPFYLVQLPNFANGHPQGWPLIREEMLRFWQEGENTGMAVAIDVGDPDDIHPANKKPVGERLARFALAETYGMDLAPSGPVYAEANFAGGEARLLFAYAGGGLASLDGEPLRHFEIAGDDRDFVPARATIDGEELVVSAPGVAEPRAVRYAWSANPEGANFGSLEGLPASPFRTDDWEIQLE